MKWFGKHKIFTAFLLVLLLLVGTVVGFVWSKLNLIDFDDGTGKDSAIAPGRTESSEEAPGDGEEDPEQLVDISGLEISETLPVIPTEEIEKKDDVVNILLLGTDERTKHLSDAARSDSMILVSINKTDKTVKLVSLERGMGVPVLEGEYEGQYDWLTHMFRYGGADLVCRTVEHCFRVEVDHYVRVNFTTVTTVVDAIGGVRISLTGAEAAYLQTVHPNLVAGVNTLNGAMALDYARLREIDSDWQRVGRQRTVILAAVDALKNASLKQLNDLLDQTLPLIQTDMTKLEIADLMLYAPNFLKSTFDQMTIPKAGTYGGMTGMGGRGLFAVDFETNSQILHEFLYGSVEEETSEPNT